MFRNFMFSSNFLFANLMACLVKSMCLVAWDGEGGAAGGAPAPAAPKTKDINDITIEDLQGIISTAVAGQTKDQMESLKKEIIDVNRKALFPNSDFDDGGEVESIGKSIIDTRHFSSKFRNASVLSGKGLGVDDGMAMGRQLLQIGGPFKKLSPEMETFAKMLKCGMDAQKISNEGIDFKAYNNTIKEHLKAALGLSEGVAADGGNLVPTEFMATVIEFATAQSPILSRVWRVPMNALTLKIPRLTQSAGSYFGGITLYWKDEAAQKTRTKPAFEQLTFTAKKLIGLIYMTDELIADSMINLVNYITGLFVRAFQYEMERVIIAGSGTGQPLGITQDSNINLVPRAGAGAVAYDDIVDMDATIDENLRDLSWITRKATVAQLRKLKDTNNQPIFHADYATMLGQKTVPDTMLGYPVYLTRNVPALGSAGDLVLGDLSQYMLAMRQDITIDQSIHLRFDYDETVYRFVARMDGMPAVPIAFAMLKAATS